MQYRFTFVIATIGMVINRTYSALSVRAPQKYSMSGRGKNGDVFNLLLGLYKLNPLRSSQVYKEFSQHVLSGHNKDNRKDYVEMHFDSNESGMKRVKIDLNEIEKVIHIKSKKPNKIFQEPEYNIESVDIENFTVDMIMNRRMNDQLKMDHEDNVDIYSTIFGHMGSNEIENEYAITKLIPVKETDKESSKASKRRSKKPSPKYLDINKAGDDFNLLVQDRNEIQDRDVMSDKLETGNVIVL